MLFKEGDAQKSINKMTLAAGCGRIEKSQSGQEGFYVPDSNKYTRGSFI